jgi:lambda family phage tail tape measure protein
MAKKETKVIISAQTSKYEKSMRDVQRESKKTSQTISKAWKRASIAVVAATAAMSVGFKNAIDAASDLQEVQGKFDVVFADQKKQAEDMAKILVDSYAMSSREAKQHMSSIQDLLVPMGMQADAALRMSGEVVKLSADLASFNNLPTAQVMLDIQSALVGNFETMKKYGVILNEHVLKQKALEMGLYSGKGMVDANVKAQVAFKLILEGSTFAIGDQIRTMGSYANQMKQLEANIEELSGVIGDELLPIATEVINQINNWVKTNDNLIRQKIPSYFSEIKDAMQKIWGVITYNPAIIEYGLIGLALFGKEGWKYVAYVAAAAHLMTVTKTLAQAMGLVAAGVLDISEVATANFKELQELVERFDFPDPFLDLQLQAKQLEERIEQLKKVTTGRIFTFRGDKEELVKLQSELIETQSKIAAIKTLAGLKVSGRLEGALADPSKYYGGSVPEAPASTTPDKLQKTKEYYKQLEFLAQEKRNFALELEAEETRMFRETLDYRLELQEQYYNSIEAAAQEARDLDEEMENEKMRSETELIKYHKQLNEDKYGDMENAMAGWANSFSFTLNDMLWGAEVTFESILESFMQMITQMMIQKYIIETMFTGDGWGWIGSLLGAVGGEVGPGEVEPGGVEPITFAAQGAAFSQGISGYSNKVVSTPTLFAFAEGIGLMGEAVPEAIMPLTRTSGGDLGVKAEIRPISQPADERGATIVIIANDAKSFDDMVKRNPASIVSVVNDALEEHTGFRDTMRGTL